MASVYVVRFLKAATLPDGTLVQRGDVVTISPDDARFFVQNKVAVIISVRTAGDS